jgi:hypothetical protein
MLGASDADGQTSEPGVPAINGERQGVMS